MIVEDRVYVDFTASEESIADGGEPLMSMHRENAYQQMAQYVAETYDGIVRRESVDFRKLRATDNERAVGIFHYRAQWYPNCETGVEFFGGPLDGELRAVPKIDGFAPPTFNVYFQPDPSLIYTPEAIFAPPEPSGRSIEYRRVGVNPKTDRLVYAHRKR